MLGILGAMGSLGTFMPIDVLFWIFVGLALGYYATSHWLRTGKAT